jgi:hypothetical protein
MNRKRRREIEELLEDHDVLDALDASMDQNG